MPQYYDEDWKRIRHERLSASFRERSLTAEELAELERQFREAHRTMILRANRILQKDQHEEPNVVKRPQADVKPEPPEPTGVYFNIEPPKEPKKRARASRAKKVADGQDS